MPQGPNYALAKRLQHWRAMVAVRVARRPAPPPPPPPLSPRCPPSPIPLLLFLVLKPLRGSLSSLLVFRDRQTDSRQTERERKRRGERKRKRKKERERDREREREREKTTSTWVCEYVCIMHSTGHSPFICLFSRTLSVVWQRSKGCSVSTHIAPSTATASVVHNKQFAWAYDGMPFFV